MQGLIDDIIESERRDIELQTANWCREAHAKLCEDLAKMLGDSPEHQFAKEMLYVASISIQLGV